MERWNELIAGHVLDNLTDSEQQELSEILSQNPQLKSEIARLRQTATLQSVQSLTVSYLSDDLPQGAEGWADSVVDRSAVATPADVSDLPQPNPIGRVPFRVPVCEESPKRRIGAGFLRWVVLILIVAISFDNWRLRRMLAVAQEQIIELETTAEFTSGSVD